MSVNDFAGSEWSAFFKLPAKKEEVIAEVKRVLEDGNASVWDNQHMSRFRFKTVIPSRGEQFYEACMIELLKFCAVRTTFAMDFFGEADAVKVRELVGRGQYESKLAVTVLSAFLTFLDMYDGWCQTYDEVLERIELYVPETLLEVRDKKVRRDYLPLKNVIDKVTSGVKSVCYLEGDNPLLPSGDKYFNRYRLTDEQNRYLTKKYGYDFNGVHNGGNMYSLVFMLVNGDGLNAFLRHALYPDEKFWEEHGSFNVYVFLTAVQEYNDLTRAEKILDYIFSVLAGDSEKKAVIDENLPFLYLDRDAFVKGLKDRDFRFSFSRFEGLYDISVIDVSELCYPLGCEKDLSHEIAEGKETFGKIMASVYPDDYKSVTEAIRNEISNPKTFEKNRTEWTIRSIFDCDIFGYHGNLWDHKAAEAYCPGFFSEENLWNRLYLKTYHVSKLSRKKGDEAGIFYEIMYDLFQFIEENFGVTTSYVRNTEGRDKAFVALKTLLSGLGTEISESRKGDYVIALLDRKVASREESMRFPVLEQLGDAVYGFAVCESLFYNPLVDEADGVVVRYEKFTDAKFQVRVARKIKLDRLYLSASRFSRKYDSDMLFNGSGERYERNEESDGYHNNRKYLADSLEMVIGCACLDLGITEAVRLTKKILRDSFPDEFGNEVHTRGDEDKYNGIEYWGEFWAETRPCPKTLSECNRSQYQMWHALDKLILCLAIGTEDVKARNYITQHYGLGELYEKDSHEIDINWALYTYFDRGLEATLDVFKDIVRENYIKLNDKI